MLSERLILSTIAPVPRQDRITVPATGAQFLSVDPSAAGLDIDGLAFSS